MLLGLKIKTKTLQTPKSSPTLHCFAYSIHSDQFGSKRSHCRSFAGLLHILRPLKNLSNTRPEIINTTFAPHNTGASWTSLAAVMTTFNFKSNSLIHALTNHLLLLWFVSMCIIHYFKCHEFSYEQANQQKRIKLNKQSANRTLNSPYVSHFKKWEKPFICGSKTCLRGYSIIVLSDYCVCVCFVFSFQE